MPDPYADLANAAAEMQTAIADAMDTRAADPVQAEMRQAYLSEIALPPGAHAVEFGCGTGAVTAELVTVAGAANAHGIEPSEVMIERAVRTYAGDAQLSFAVGDAKATGLGAGTVDLVCMHTLLCHVPGPEDAVAEAFRVLKPGGVLAIFDGDYDTSTCAIGDDDPLDRVVAYMISENVTNRWIMRRIGPILLGAGFEVGRRRAHAYLADGAAAYFLTVIDRGTAVMASRALLSDAAAEALRAEARDRVARGAFFGFMSYVSVLATKPEDGP